MDKSTNRYYKKRFEILAKDMEMRAQGYHLAVADLIGMLHIPEEGEEYRAFCKWLMEEGGNLWEPEVVEG